MTTPAQLSRDDLGRWLGDARRLRQVLTAWLLVEAVGLGLAGGFGWEGLLQPVVAASLIARGLALGAFLAAARAPLRRVETDSTPSGAFIVGACALALSTLLVIDLIPPPFTERGWDAALGLLLLLLLTATALFALAPVKTAARALAQPAALARLAPLGLLAGLTVLTLFPVIAAEASPTPWLSVSGAVALALAAGLSRALEPSQTALSLFTTLIVTAAFADDPSARAFVAAPGVVAILTAIAILRRALEALITPLDRMHQAASSARPPPHDPSLPAGAPMSEAEAEALVDRELRLHPEPAPAFSEAELAAPISPLELAPSPSLPTPPSLPFDALAALSGRLHVLGAVTGLLALFGAFISLTGVGGIPLIGALGHGLLAALLALACLWLTRLSRLAAPCPPFTAAATLTALAAATTIARASAPTHLEGLLALLVTVSICAALLGLLQGHRRLLAIAPSDRLGRRVTNLSALLIALSCLGAVSAAVSAAAPGDMRWLGAPLHAAFGLVAIGTAIGLAYTLHDLRVLLEDRALSRGRSSS